VSLTRSIAVGSSKPAPAQQEVCRYFRKGAAASCWHGDKCRFKHAAADERSSKSSAPAPPVLPCPKDEQVAARTRVCSVSSLTEHSSGSGTKSECLSLKEEHWSLKERLLQPAAAGAPAAAQMRADAQTRLREELVRKIAGVCVCVCVCLLSICFRHALLHTPCLTLVRDSAILYIYIYIYIYILHIYIYIYIYIYI
jgi:hypothetical protein